MRHAIFRVTWSVWMALLAVSTAAALDIRVSFDNDHSTSADFPSYDPDASLLGGLVEYAASVFEEIIEDNHVLELTYRWDQDLAENTGVTISKHDFGSEQNGREVSGELRFDTDADWYIDPTPNNDSEFNMVQWLYDYGPTQLSTAQQSNRFAGDVPALFEAGYQGEALSTAPADALNNFDLLTLVFHEMGHALGLSGKLDALVDETEIELGDSTGDFDVGPNLVGGNVLAIKVRDDDDEDNNYNDRAHLFGGSSGTPPGPALMTRIGTGERRRPSAADILAMATVSNWTDLDLPRKDFLTGTSWHIGGNWLGGAVPGLGDEVFLRHGGSVFLTGPGRAGDLLIDEGVQLITGGNVLEVLRTATISNGELLVGGIFGPVADAKVDAGQLVLKPASTLRLLGNPASGEEAVVAGGEVVLAGGMILLNDQGVGRIDSSTTVGANTNISIDSGSRLDLYGDLTGGADLIKTGSGTLVLDGENGNWSGDLIVDGGTVVIAPGDSLGNSTTVNLRTPLGIADFTAVGQQFGGLEGDGTVLVGPDNIFFGTNNGNTVFTGVVLPPFGGTGGFAKVGTGTTTFADDAVAPNVSLASSRGGGTLVFSGSTFVSTSLLEATNGSRVRIEGDANVIAFASDFSNPGLFELFGGTFQTTAFDGVLLNQGGTFSPGIDGDATRVLSLSDNYNNSADSTLVIDIGGLMPGDHDQLSLPIGPPGTGKFAGLGGTLEINLVEGFVPSLGDTFTIIKARSVGGAFDVIYAPIFDGMTFDLVVANAGSNEMHAILHVIEAPLLAGDYNQDGVVDAADYVVWRDNLGAPAGTLPNDLGGGPIGQAQYDTWRANFGATASGSGLNAHPPASAIPEPCTVHFISAAIVLLLGIHGGDPSRR